MSQGFLTAAEEVKTLVEKLSDAQKLSIYGLFKQATVGDVNTSRPGMFDLKGKAKWDAWSKNKGMSKDEAEAKYIEMVNEVKAMF